MILQNLLIKHVTVFLITHPCLKFYNSKINYSI